MRIVRRLSLATFYLAISPEIAAAEKRVALVIGNSAYQHTAALKVQIWLPC